MAGNLSFSRYVEIESGVIGAGGTRQRDLIGRIFTSNPRCPSDKPVEFSDSNGVGRLFGFDSNEYKRSVFYFGWVSPNITTASRISFARYTDGKTAPQIYGSPDKSTVDDIVALGEQTDITLVIGDTEYSIQNIDMSTGVASYSDVASKIQNAMADQFPDSTQIAQGTVSFDAGDSIFIFTGGALGAATIDITQTPLSLAIGWNNDAVLVDGTDSLRPREAIQRSDVMSNNYASVLFLGNLSLQDHVDIATTLNSLGSVAYMYCVGVTDDDAESWSAAMKSIDGVAMTLVTDESDYADMVPMIQIAATNYNNQNATSSFMFREFALTPTVTDDGTADTYDAARINYYGRTQQAGREYSFYQRGVLMGGNTAPLDQNVYANEIWLKDYAGVEFMNLLRGLPELPANADGIAYGMNTLQGVVEQGIFNGVISVGKTLTRLQQAAVTNFSGEPDAWRQVENIGYWFDVNIEEEVSTSGITEYILTYRLIYAKKDTIRKVEGRHALV